MFFYNGKRKDLRILPVEITANSGINSVFYFKNKLYLATNDGVEIWDVRDFYHPFRITSFFEEYPNDIKVINSLLCLATKKDGLKIYDIKDINLPQKIAKINTLGTPTNIFILKNYLYLADKEGGLRIIDIKEPYSPKEIYYDDEYVDTENGLKVIKIGEKRELLSFFTNFSYLFILLI